jgi:23S rRNA pseudouridine1911/1915/1917 synthase
VERPGIVHRIDRETSGIVLIAKTKEAYFFLKQQFQQKTVKKRYHAFVYGIMKDDRGTIERQIGRSPVDIRKWSAGRGARGILRNAITRWRVISRGGNLTFLEAMPLTGRTHQIRVHLLAEHHPVVCDSLYARTMEGALGFTRLALHARGITFLTPVGEGGKEVVLEAPYPADFVRAIERHTALLSDAPVRLRE